MNKVPKIVPVTDLRVDAAVILKQLQSSDEPFIITQRGRATAILFSINAYEKNQNEKEILKLLAVGEKEILEGKGHTLESVLKEADGLLKDE